MSIDSFSFPAISLLLFGTISCVASVGLFLNVSYQSSQSNESFGFGKSRSVDLDLSEDRCDYLYSLTRSYCDNLKAGNLLYFLPDKSKVISLACKSFLKLVGKILLTGSIFKMILPL